MAGITTSPQLRESPETANLKAGVDESCASAKPVNIRSRYENFFIWSFGNIPLEIESTERRHEEQHLGEERPRLVEEPTAGAVVLGVPGKTPRGRAWPLSP